MGSHEAGAVLFTINLRAIADFYAQAVGMKICHAADDHFVLETGSFRLTVHQILTQYAKDIVIATPPKVRESAAIKLSFRVDSIAQAREAAASLGGAVDGPDREWSYDGATICGGHDPDGNVFQLFEPTAPQSA